MEALIIILIAVIFTIAYLWHKIPLDLQEIKERQEKENVLSEIKIKHLNGHPYLKENDSILFQIRNNKTIYFRKENTDIGTEIPISKLIRYEVKTESEIRHDVTLGRLLALGIFAFGVKKKSRYEEQFLIISYMQNNVKVDCLFKQSTEKQQLGNIISTLNRLKIEDSKYYII